MCQLFFLHKCINKDICIKITSWKTFDQFDSVFLFILAKGLNMSLSNEIVSEFSNSCRPFLGHMDLKGTALPEEEQEVKS